jgi:Fe2+ or Zn2+ uptake regulation protein
MSDKIQSVAKVLKHPRRVEILHILSQKDRMTAKEISNQMKSNVLPQYLYTDLEMMRSSGMIEREFDDDNNCFVYSISGNVLKIDFVNLEIDWCS